MRVRVCGELRARARASSWQTRVGGLSGGGTASVARGPRTKHKSASRRQIGRPSMYLPSLAVAESHSLRLVSSRAAAVVLPPPQTPQASCCCSLSRALPLHRRPIYKSTCTVHVPTTYPLTHAFYRCVCASAPPRPSVDSWPPVAAGSRVDAQQRATTKCRKRNECKWGCFFSDAQKKRNGPSKRAGLRAPKKAARPAWALRNRV